MQEVGVVVVEVVAVGLARVNKILGEDMNESTLIGQVSGTLLYAFIGTVVFLIVIFLIESITKFSIQKQVVEDGNIAVAIVLASIIASLGMIVSSAIG